MLALALVRAWGSVALGVVDVSAREFRSPGFGFAKELDVAGVVDFGFGSSAVCSLAGLGMVCALIAAVAVDVG